MNQRQWPASFLKLIENVQQKRARTVLDHILEHGHVTTEELKDLYGYNHPPRAARDVREQGIPLETFRVAGTDGRSIAAYRFGDPAQVRTDRTSGRTAFAARLKEALIEQHGTRCYIYSTSFPERDLQIDHRVPYEVAGDTDAEVDDIGAYMLLCPSANRAKSWSCEHCPNWQTKDPETCRTCYWAFPEDYAHVATQELRRLDIIWSGAESTEYEQLRAEAGGVAELPGYVKAILRAHVARGRKKPKTNATA